jgi:hypothetical protein
MVFRILLSWLIDLLADVAEHKEENKMTEQNLGKFSFLNLAFIVLKPAIFC